MIVSEKTGRRRRSYSLRTRVAAAAALGATIIVAALSWVTVTAIERNNLAQADQQLRVASQLTMIEPVIAVTILGVLPQDNMAMTVRNADGSLASTKAQLPPLPVGNHTVTVNGDTYRVLTTTENQPAGRVVSLGISTTQTEAQTAAQRRWVMLAAAAAVAAAAGLGWLFGGRAVRPIVSLTRQVDQRDPAGDSGTPLPVDGSGVREAEKLAEAVNMMLERLDRAQAQTAAALETARDFAAVSAHELRTPLTAMRTDLEVMRTLQLDEAQRTEILEDLHRGQNRVESTLSALERLARGDLTSERDHVETDVAELCDAAAHDAMRHFPDLKVRLNVGSELVTRGLPTGLRLAVDNALTNSARHGRATEALLSAHRDPNGYIVISVDDNGVGIPPGERRAVFERFFRGSRASKGGSGLGLALVAQQAQLHGGRAYFDDGNLGGVRLVLVLPDRSAPATEPIDLRHA